MRPILVIEDDADTREAYFELLQMSGFEVISAATGAEALTLAAAHSPFAVLLDLTLPDVDGRALAEQLKTLEQTKGAAIAAATGHSLERREQAQFSKVFTKPVDLDQLISWLKGLT